MGRQEGCEGWWNTHEFYKRTIEEDFKGWMGWRKFFSLVKPLEELQRNLLLTLFFCGSRANEILLAEGGHFQIKEQTIDVVRLPAFMKREERHWEEGEVKFRYFPVNRKEPLTDAWIEFLESKTEKEKLFDFKYGTLYNLITGIEWRGKNANLWPHRIRGERASQLVVDYHFSLYELKRFFGWTQDKTPGIYIELGMRDLKRAYGVKEEKEVFQPEPEKDIVGDVSPEPKKLTDEEYQKLLKEVLGRDVT